MSGAEAMKGAREGKPRKRYCPRNHDTWDVGRIGNGSSRCRKCQLEDNKRKAARDLKERRKARTETQPLPELRALRLKRGVAIHTLAWECHSLSDSDLYAIEEGHRWTNHAEKVELFQAFNVIAQRELEEREAAREQITRRQRAGVA